MYLDDSVLTAGITGHLTLTLKSSYCASKITNILEHNNLNLSAPQKEVGLWHFRFAHCGIPWVQSLMRIEKVEVGNTGTPPIIPTRNKTTCKVDPPKCPGCILAKQHRLNPGSQTTVNKPERELALRRKASSVGDSIHCDQYVSKVPGRLPHTYGKEAPTERFRGGTMFVDAFSTYIHLVNQVTLTAGETLMGKRQFDVFAAQHGIKLRHFHTDNHPFSAEAFVSDLHDNEQTISYSGVGAHFQNGVAERCQQTITQWA